MEVIKISPRGYCYGVVDAMVLAQKTAQNFDFPRPIYILGMIVHNSHVVKAFEEQGIITLDGPNRMEMLERIDKGTVIFTAHGVSPQVKERAREKGLTVVDATCPDVTKTHDLIREKVAQGYHVIYIGKKGHPEPEGALGVAPGRVHLIEREEDIDKLDVPSEKLIVTNQTTMSQWDIKHIMNKVIQKYPHCEVHNEICLATQVRQEAVAEQAGEADLLIVVGDPRSNNSNRLAQVAEEIAGVPAYRIADLGELNLEWLKGKKKVAVTSGASTPTPLTKEVIAFLEQYDETKPETWEKKRTVNMKKILPAYKR
ncbi:MULTISPECIES: 4-hydroxy-3-methylbut-2-enyl diphosphate reductase [Aneurinibacillus]|uniref:4-hydroxy-3-methylbut-2-enyl diphosphate reductase n=1 Tax=Aneurinibacillus thermoaerophilus TaxID=143495 RepID=A0A1G8CLB9_ANETH|nr:MULTISPECIES: 4-hydroxy-3-methylbut-2-enyl diphosphate reductase [Aneurinibacillus]AMA71911.1 4-hydroxy-3-methylbut-2-enyl diphosphate reductase [Aneurinibacillus sp. XH2]MED0680306.1 4-hydroxy-3-methylbut-2-enyl diphosphate reductase [Aneurinibacillus thermoaerophilus]MED0737067.1 4-hydroxy-3-methylbut-2-enyl diphosphate reductase [Aneurinibacillus thermoaerophilus]MED0757363.1 4-hydroxy-3-methylbut-2-enyl diphosphate reductase [Aneurinibacillus thermoaerophilus]MED0762100.1 4-hydroxy-3-me